MGFIIMIIVGGLIGWLAGAILGKDIPGGIIGNIIAGLIGSAIGSKLLGTWGPVLGGVPILPALIGSIVLIDRKEENTWINIHYVQTIRALKDKKCKITFVDNQTIVVNISAHSMHHQYLNGIYYYYMMDRAARVATFDPESPIDYTKPQLNIYEALAKYSLFENK